MRNPYCPDGHENLIAWVIFVWGWQLQRRQPRYCSEVNIQIRGATLNQKIVWEEHINE